MSQSSFFCNSIENIERVYGGGRSETLKSELNFFPPIVSAENFALYAPELHEVELIFSTWGMPQLAAEQVAQLPALKAVFYAAGSVQYFARPFLEAGVTVVSAWAANAIPVAQFTLGQILLAAKGYFEAARACRTPGGRATFDFRHPGLYGTAVSILGAGMIGSRVIEWLRPHELDVLVYDPFLSEEDAASLGARKVELVEAFERGVVVSNHIADLPETRCMLTRDLFERMPRYATFINTGRGATVDEPGMIAALEARPDLTALLDVTFPEPPLSHSPLYRLDNVLMTPHIAGNMGSEVLRQADCVIEEWQRYREGLPLRYAVTLEMLKTMA